MAGFSPTSALLALLFAPQVIQSMTSMYPPFQVGMARKGFKDDPNILPTPDNLVGQVQKGIISDDNFIDIMSQAGYSKEFSSNMLSNARTYLSALDYVTAWRRSAITEDQLNETLKEQGLNTSDIATLKTITIYYPTPQDLIRFGIRDVFSPATIELYGLDQDYPTNLDQMAPAAGLTSETAHWYWMAHWQLPSPDEVYRMGQRGIISEDDVATYLRVADFMPYWREKLIALAYDPIDRIDIRRIYDIGLFSKDDVVKRYQDLGYSPDDAALLAEFTVQQSQASKGVTASSLVVDSYKAGTIDRATAMQKLADAKVSTEDANLLLDNADSAIQQELINLEADAIIDQYQRGEIDMSEVQTQLTKIGVPARVMQLTIQRELAQARKRTKSGTKSDLETWWKMGLIGHDIFTSKMTALGYNGTDITMYLAELQVGELAGADKKYPWADAMRDYSDGLILADGLRTQLTTAGVAEATINTLLTLASQVKG